MPAQVKMPTASTNDIIAALRTPSGPTLLPSEATVRRETLQHLSTIFSNHADEPDPDTPHNVVPPGLALLRPPSPAQPPRVEPAQAEPTVTYANTKGTKRRKRSKQPNTTTVTAPAPLTPTTPSIQSTQPVPLPKPDINPHQTRSRSQRANTVFNTFTDFDPDNEMIALSFPAPAAPTTPIAHAEWICHYANAVICPTTGASLEYLQLLKGDDAPEWIHGTATEIGRLAQGHHPHTTSGSDTLFFIKHTDKPFDRVATYLRIVAALRPHKPKPSASA